MVLLVLGQGVKVTVGGTLSETSHTWEWKRYRMVEIIILLLTVVEEDRREIERMQDQCLIKASKDQFLVLIFLCVCICFITLIYERLNNDLHANLCQFSYPVMMGIPYWGFILLQVVFEVWVVIWILKLCIKGDNAMSENIFEFFLMFYLLYLIYMWCNMNQALVLLTSTSHCNECFHC